MLHPSNHRSWWLDFHEQDQSASPYSCIWPYCHQIIESPMLGKKSYVDYDGLQTSDGLLMLWGMIGSRIIYAGRETIRYRSFNLLCKILNLKIWHIFKCWTPTFLKSTVNLFQKENGIIICRIPNNWCTIFKLLFKMYIWCQYTILFYIILYIILPYAF